MAAGRGTGLVRAALLSALVLCVAEVASAEPDTAQLIPAKVGIGTLTKAQRANLWVRVDEYATVDAMHEYCGAKRKLNIQRRALNAVGSCVDTGSLRKVAAVFRSKKAAIVKGWETAHTDPAKKKEFCELWAAKMPGYARIIDSQIAEAASMCSACLFC